VPLHAARIRERTYNQSLYIAKGIQEIIHKRIENTCLQRIMYSGSQTLLNVSERSSNMSDTIFKVNNKDRIHHASILLVDDIFTTGATLEACANTLLLEGASCVHGITIASAPLR
jgi:predicted amidophosphoribosyltransferase